MTDIDRFKHDDFRLWVRDSEGKPAAVVPVAPRGSGDGRVRVVHSTPGTRLHARHCAAAKRGTYLEMAAGSAMARAAPGGTQTVGWDHDYRRAA